MDQSLQKITDFVQQTWQLSVEEKALLDTAVKDVEGEMAIRLEETINELEQQRKVVEEQNRELEIESSLERVRAGAMAMRQSAELGQLIYVLYQELTKLDAQLDRCFIMIVNPENKGIIWWLAGKEGLLDENGFYIQMNQHPSHLMYLDCWQKRKKKWHYLFEGQEKRDWDDFGFNNTALAKLPEFIKQDMASVKKIHLSGSSDTFGNLVTGSLEPLKEEHQDIISRFTIVFNQAYTRFLDLQKAEAQAREAIKQSSLDRVRGQIASMRTTADLQSITPLIWHELIALGVSFVRCGVFIVNEETVHVQAFLSARDGSSLAALDLPFDSSELTSNLMNNWRKGLIFKTHWNKEEFLSWMQSMVKEGQVPNTETYLDASNPPESLDLHFIPFAQGMLYVGNIQPLTNEELDLVRSLAEAFSIAYARYEDFRKLEMAKQSIETALAELKATQSQLVQSEKMASLGELTAGIAHEIQNPLNFVNNFSEVNSELIDEMDEEIEKGNLDEVRALAKDIRENEQKILHHGKRADAIVKGMLQHSRSSSGLKEPTDINALADEYLRLAYHGLRARDKSLNATMNTNFDNSIGKINVVPQDIGRVILNLITNAFYAVDSKKNASPSSATGHYEPTVSITTKKAGHTISISVKDNGTGIPEQIRNKIFLPFFTTKPTGEGTGLGLSMSYDIVTKGHGGELQVETVLGEGSVFTIHLPVIVTT